MSGVDQNIDLYRIPSKIVYFLAVVLVTLGITLSSSDVFLILSLGGNIKPGQFLLFIPIALFALSVFVRDEILLPNTFLIFVFVFLYDFVFAFFSPYILKSVVYSGWFFFDLMLVFFFVNLSDVNKAKLHRIISDSYVLIAAFGLAQFILGILGIDILVAQWWLGVVPRINGLSYEPSYFSTFLLLGWGYYFWLNITNTPSVGFFGQKWSLFVITLAIVLSSSRMSIGIMLSFSLLTMFLSFFNKKITIPKYYWIGFFLIIVFVIYLVVSYPVLLAGLGIAEGSAHSADDRIFQQNGMIIVFLDNMWSGVGYGALSAYFAMNMGLSPAELSFESLKNFEGGNVLVQIYAAWGLLFGSLFLLSLFYHLLTASANQYARAVSIGLVLCFTALLLNQNVFRVYFWIALSLLMCLQGNCLKKIRLRRVRR
ncbi:hypothetical protein ACFOSS_16655 [Pseudaeromonas sharmana]|uniref:O-antigen ligase-like membrane protein n=1 Tax=Pseudaeromonas sharmana TaxID=328412 RepID=A0ABV8CS91_9GAMM